MEFWHKKPFSIRFVHKSRKFSNFEPTFDYIMLHNLRTVRPIFPKIAPKVAQDFKEKIMKACGAEKNFCKTIVRNVEGGGFRPPGPFRAKVKTLLNNAFKRFTYLPYKVCNCYHAKHGINNV